MRLILFPETLAIVRQEPRSELPAWALTSSFFSVSRTNEELSIVCDQALVSANARAERDWRMFRVAGALDFGLTGVIASIATPLARAKVSIFSISTFDTDYVLVKDRDLPAAMECLMIAGFEIDVV